MISGDIFSPFLVRTHEAKLIQHQANIILYIGCIPFIKGGALHVPKKIQAKIVSLKKTSFQSKCFFHYLFSFHIH